MTNKYSDPFFPKYIYVVDLFVIPCLLFSLVARFVKKDKTWSTVMDYVSTRAGAYCNHYWKDSTAYRQKVYTNFFFFFVCVCVAEADEKIGIEEMVDEFVTFFVAGMYAVWKCWVAAWGLCENDI